MRRFLIPSALVAVLATTAPAVPASATPPSAPPANSSPAAARALEKVQEILAGRAPEAAADGSHSRSDHTTALASLFTRLSDLDAADRRTAESLLARPTASNDSDCDPAVGVQDCDTMNAAEWDANERLAAQEVCTTNFCLHWVPTGTQNAAGQWSRHKATQAYVDATVAALSNVWETEVTTMGYQPPASDGATGDARTDIYLSDTLTATGGLYGYAVPEDWALPDDETSGAAYGYMVIDNDMIEAQTEWLNAADLRDLTSAHEFFHLVQFGYDVTEAAWLFESTAAWMEEQVYDEHNDKDAAASITDRRSNLSWLPASSMRNTWLPLDSFNDHGTHYANWVFHQLVSERWGPEVIKTIWEKAAARIGDNTRSALDSTYKALGSSLANEFQMFTAASLAPGRYWHEGANYYPAATMGKNWTLGTSKKSIGSWNVTIDHLAAADFVVKPDSTLGGNWKFRLKVDGPTTGNTGYAMVVYKGGRIGTSPLTFDSSGNLTRSFPFSSSEVSRVAISLGNSTHVNDRTTSFSGAIWR